MRLREIMTSLCALRFGSWSTILRMLTMHRRRFALSIVLSLVGIGLSIVVPILSQKIIDSVMTGRDGRAATVFAGIAIVAAAARHISTRWQNNLVNDLEARLTTRLSRRIYIRMMRLPFQGSLSSTGSSINLLNESQRVATFILSTAPNFFFTLLGAIVSFIVAFYYDPLISVLAAGVAAVFALFARKTNAQLGEASRASFRLNGVLQGATAETVNNLRAIKSNAVERFFIQRWTAKSDEAVRARWRILNLSHSYAFTMGLLTEILILLVVLVGCLRILNGDLTIGGLLALQMLVTRAVMPMLTSAGILVQFHSVSTTVAAIGAYLRHEPERADRAPAHRPVHLGAITVDGLTLSYPQARQPALNGVSLKLPLTGVVAIVGRNGSGKSSLLRALIGLERQYDGQVAIGGVDVRSYAPRWLRQRFGVVDQETSLFSGSVRENIQAAVSRPLTEVEIDAALQFSSAETFVQNLPKGLETELLPAAQNLSGGQRQRLAISRAASRSPEIAVFDEPTSALDAEQALALERKILAMGRERLIILVTHHLFSARAADLIVVLEEGMVAGIGQHEELVETCEPYKTLWRDYVRA